MIHCLVSKQLAKVIRDLALNDFDVESDRFMICGSPAMLRDTCLILNEIGFKEARSRKMGHYVIERAFVEK